MTARELAAELKKWCGEEEERLRDERERPSSNQRDRDHIGGALSELDGLRAQLRKHGVDS